MTHKLKAAVSLGAVFLIILGVAHAVHVALSEDVEPYLWMASIILVVQGLLTLLYFRRTGK